MGLMIDAYAAAAKGYRERATRTNPREKQRLDQIVHGETLVVQGCYDQIEYVLDALSTPYERMPASQVCFGSLYDAKTLFVNCPGDLDEEGIDAVRQFVKRGGTLVSTDWALPRVVQRAFPGVIEHNGLSTRDDVVRVEVAEAGAGLLGDLVDADDTPCWWLEGASHPIRILDEKRAEVLVRSDEMAEKYKDDSIVVRFREEDGVVYHMVSHIFLQRTDLRSKRQRTSPIDYLKKKGATVSADDLKSDQYLGEVEAAFASVGLVGKILAREEK
jgi:hypothetical protein